MIKGVIQEDIKIINIYAPNIGTPQYIRQCLQTKGGIHSNIIILGDFNTMLTSMDRSPRQKINKETQALNDTLDYMYSIDIGRASESSRIHILFKCTWNILQDRSHAGPKSKPQ